jgi:hypothetical protein
LSSNLPLMELASILTATDNFPRPTSSERMGFGPIYRMRNQPRQLWPLIVC